MTRSLRRHLSLMLGIAVLLSGLAAGLASFVLAYADAREFQDDVLRQIAVLGDGGGGAASAHRAENAASDPESRIRVIRPPADPRPAWLPADLPRGFHTLDSDSGRLRVFVHDSGAGQRRVVTQPTDARDEIAINSALRTLVPLLLLLPLLAGLVVRIVRRELAPIARMARGLDARPADRPGAIDDAGVPDEIRPFVLAINRLLERVSHLMTQQRRFIADAAHELRTPLTALSVQAQNLQQAGTVNVMQSRLAPLQAGIERARQLTEQLLSLARTQAGTSDMGGVDVSVLARDVLADFMPRAEAKGIDLGLEEREPFSLWGSPESLRLIVANALDNALKYTAAGGEVTLRLRTEDETGIIEIVDNGPGIPPSERDRVFDPFYRLPGSSDTGSGLGLSIAREAASRLGGRLQLRGRTDGTGLIVDYRQRRQDGSQPGRGC